jgi:hypothetical protein
MRGFVNDCLRALIGWGIKIFGRICDGLLRFKLLCFNANQQRLKRKYDLRHDTPVLTYGPELAQSIQRAAVKSGKGARFAITSGSTAKAKEILYTKRRLFLIKRTFSDMFARACCAFRLKRTSLYVFNSFATDASLTSLLLEESGLPNYLSTLQAPYRVQQHPAIQSLISKYGSAAVRLWILALSNPGVLYSTNPSTLWSFLDELAHEWQRSTRLIRDWCADPDSFSCALQKIARRIESQASARRLKQIATTAEPLPLSVCAPAVAAYICWTGGYVQPFLDRLEKHLSPSRYKRIPMYSMSTETIETIPHFENEYVAFLPLGAGVVYEFIEEKALDRPDNLLRPRELEPGKLYAMVVSNNYGLRRYQTDDLFLCKRKISDLPDLTFARRRSLEYSFTGEKLTAQQLSTVFDQLRAFYPALLTDRFLTCVPSLSANALPHYKVLMIGDSAVQSSHALLATRCEELLCKINSEYKSKRANGVLGPVSFMDARVKDFAERYSENGNWEDQFKFLPLCLSGR